MYYVLATIELLILSLELVKNRVGVMTVDTRKTFIGTILVGLIEKTQDIKVMKAICKVRDQIILLLNDKHFLSDLAFLARFFTPPMYVRLILYKVWL